MTKYVVLYESADDVARKAPGTKGSPSTNASAAARVGNTAMEPSACGSANVGHGVVRHHEIRGWNEILTQP